MKKHNCVLLKLTSNVASYKITIYDRFGFFQKEINNKLCSVGFYTLSNYVKLVFTPINTNSKNNIVFCLKLNKSNYNLNLNFISVFSITQGNYNFFLTDRNYGLKLNGVLTFNKI